MGDQAGSVEEQIRKGANKRKFKKDKKSNYLNEKQKQLIKRKANMF